MHPCLDGCPEGVPAACAASHGGSCRCRLQPRPCCFQRLALGPAKTLSTDQPLTAILQARLEVGSFGGGQRAVQAAGAAGDQALHARPLRRLLPRAAAPAPAATAAWRGGGQGCGVRAAPPRPAHAPCAACSSPRCAAPARRAPGPAGEAAKQGRSQPGRCGGAHAGASRTSGSSGARPPAIF